MTGIFSFTLYTRIVKIRNMCPEKSREINLTLDQVQSALLSFDQKVVEKKLGKHEVIEKYFELQARLAAFSQGEPNPAYSQDDSKILPVGVYRFTTGMQHVIPFAGIKRNDAVLDVGCGIGADAYFAAVASGPLGRVLGIDVCGYLIDRAKAWAADKGFRHVRFVHGPAEELPLSDRIIDAAVLNHSFHLMDHEQVIKELARVMKRMGRVIIADVFRQPDAPPKKGAFEQPSNWIHFAAGAKSFDEYREMAKKYGFHSSRFVRSSGADPSCGCMIIERMPTLA